ncbi:hypothetical protein [Oceaniferula spumae]
MTIFLLSAIVACAADPPMRVRDASKVETASRVIVLGWDYELKNRDPIKLKTSFGQPEQIKQLLSSFADAPTQVGGLPLFAGHLCHLVFLGEKDEPLAYVYVNTLGAFCELRSVKQDEDGKMVPDYNSEATYFYAPKLGKLLVKQLNDHDPEYYAALEKSVTANLGMTLENALFGNDKANKAQK